MFKFYRRYRGIKVIFLTTLIVSLLLGQVSVNWRGVALGNLVAAQTTNASQQVKRGIELYNIGNFLGAIDLWKAVLNEYKKTNNLASAGIVSENLARAYQQLGASQEEINEFTSAINYYRAAQDLQQVGRMQTELAQAYNNIGQARKAIALVCGEIAEKSSIGKPSKSDCKKHENTSVALAEKYKDNRGKVAALGVLGEAYRLLGEYEIAIYYLQEAQKNLQREFDVLLLNSLGNAYVSNGARWKLFAESAKQSDIPNDKFVKKSLEDYKQAYESFQKSFELARASLDKPNQMRSLLNLIRLGYRTHELNLLSNSKINNLIADAVTLLDALPDNSQKALAAVDLATLPQDFQVTSPLTVPLVPKLPEAENLLKKAIAISSKIKDSRAASFAWGALGHLYESRQDYPTALKYTQEALLVADQKIAARDILYLWEWQVGRILKAQNKESKAVVDAYQRAFNTLESIRSDILTSDRNVQFDFRDVVKPLYRELAQSQLELASSASLKVSKQPKEKLQSVIETVDALKLAELQNYFGSDCIVAALNNIKVDDKKLLRDDTAILSSVILDKGTAILLTLPSGETKFEWIKDSNGNISGDTLNKTVSNFRQGLIDTFNLVYDTTNAATLYNWIIKPFETELNPDKIKTLVFIQDGFLRQIPMAALYDSENRKYLIEKYAIATTPSIRLTTPKQLDRTNTRALVAGVSEEAIIDGKIFSQLSSVELELTKVKTQFSNYTSLLNAEFLPNVFKDKLNKNKYPIIHIATHAQFGTIPEDTFIVAGKNNKFTIAELEETLRNLPHGSESIELLALTACQTALGDDRSTLGLAGIALQVGVRSAVASLWSVGDESTSILASEFYKNLKNTKNTKAEALRQAQIKMIQARNSKVQDIKREYAHPGHWSPFILIGNWL